jgi:hypothetical protein
MLMLEMRFRLSVLDTIEASDVINLNGSFLLGAIADEALHGTVAANEVYQGTSREFGFRAHRVALTKFKTVERQRADTLCILRGL